MEEYFDENSFYYASVDKAFLSLRDNELKEIEQRISEIFDGNRNVLDVVENGESMPLSKHDVQSIIEYFSLQKEEDDLMLKKLPYISFKCFFKLFDDLDLLDLEL